MIKISQCMIVKNEERNIIRALEWAKPFVYEQIVVDTGSTDRTVELAEQIGATVYPFEWINDFSAARNFSMDQGTGDWLLVLDADEYMTPEDASIMVDYLNRLQSNPEQLAGCSVVNCKLINVDDNNKATSVYDAMRLVKSDSAVRYTGSIHERLDVEPGKVIWTDEFKIIHTGYSESAIIESNKIERNIEMLRKAIALSEDNLALKVYLADSLKHREDKESKAEAEQYFTEAIEDGADKIFYKLRVKAYIHFLNKYANNPEKRNEYEELCKRALVEFPDSLDFEYFKASILNTRGDFQEAWDILKAGEERQKTGGNTGITYHVEADPTMLYGQLLLAAQGLENLEGIIEYAALILKTDKTRLEILSPLIAIMLKDDVSAEKLLDILSGIYNMNDPKDLLIIVRAAKNCGAIEFAGMIMQIAGEIMGK